MTRSELQADIAELDALIDDRWESEKGCLNCGAVRVYSGNSSSLLHKRMNCTVNLRILRAERYKDIEFLDEVRKRSKFEE